MIKNVAIQTPKDTLYDTLKSHVALDKRVLECFVAVVSAMGLTSTCVLARLIEHVALPGNKATRRSRIKRLLNQPLDSSFLLPFVFHLISGHKFELILDRTNWKIGKVNVNYLLLSIGWGKISLPIMWEIIDNGGNSSTKARKILIDRFLKAYEPFKNKKKISGFLADREFIGAEWFKYLRKNKIKICIRLKKIRSLMAKCSFGITLRVLVKIKHGQLAIRPAFMAFESMFLELWMTKARCCI